MKKIIAVCCFIYSTSFLSLSQEVENIASFGINNEVLEKIEKAKKLIDKSNTKDLGKNLNSAINELNSAMCMAVDYPLIHYFLAHSYITAAKKEERYKNEFSSDKKYDNVLLVKSLFHFLLYMYLNPYASDIEESLDMIEEINTIYVTQTEQNFYIDNEIVNTFFSDNTAVYGSENIGLLCYSLGLEADKNNDRYKAVAYFSLSGQFRLPDEKTRYSQNRFRVLVHELERDEKWKQQVLEKTAKLEIPKWNNTFLDNLYYSYVYQTPPVNHSSGLHGLQVTWLRNGRFATYFSILANSLSAVSLRSFDNEDSEDYIRMENTDKISFMYVSAGVTKKIYRPFFLTAGIGAGLATSSSKYTNRNISTEVTMIDYSSWSISPEIGVIMSNPFPFRLSKPAPVQFYVTASMKYVLPIQQFEYLSYKRFAYLIGVGLVIPEPLKRRYLMYNLEFPYYRNMAFDDKENMQGVIFGSSDGLYFSLRMNRLFLADREEYSIPSRKGNLFFTTGYEHAILYPLHLYAGLGIAYQKWISHSMEMEKKMNLNAEAGLSLQLSYLRLRVGITIPKFNIDESYLSLGLGANF